MAVLVHQTRLRPDSSATRASAIAPTRPETRQTKRELRFSREANRLGCTDPRRVSVAPSGFSEGDLHLEEGTVVGGPSADLRGRALTFSEDLELTLGVTRNPRAQTQCRVRHGHGSEVRRTVGQAPAGEVFRGGRIATQRQRVAGHPGEDAGAEVRARRVRAFDEAIGVRDQPRGSAIRRPDPGERHRDAQRHVTVAVSIGVERPGHRSAQIVELEGERVAHPG
jgi:hypothetical protein